MEQVLSQLITSYLKEHSPERHEKEIIFDIQKRIDNFDLQSLNLYEKTFLNRVVMWHLDRAINHFATSREEQSKAAA